MTLVTQEPSVLSVPSWPALCRPSTSLRALRNKGVDGRHKAGHDDEHKAHAVEVAP
jgi:hypothetical protein